jgi:hypothetical protein
LRHAVEIRSESFNDPEFIAALRRRRLALVLGRANAHIAISIAISITISR